MELPLPRAEGWYITYQSTAAFCITDKYGHIKPDSRNILQIFAEKPAVHRAYLKYIATDKKRIE